MIVLLRRRGLGCDRFMQCGIEGLADRIDYLETRVAKCLQQLFLNHVDALHDRRGVGRSGIDVGETRHVIERLDQLSNEISLGAGAGVLALLCRALSIIVVFGRQSQIPVALSA
jgi:hypothetical protein